MKDYRPMFKRMIDLKISSGELTKRANVSSALLTRMRNNKEISLESAIRISKVLGCKVEDLYDSQTDADG